MNQPAKAQEPSMEEILASIRRIIADDDAGKPAEPAKPVVAAAPPPAAKPVPTDVAAMSQDDIDAMLSGLDTTASVKKAAPAFAPSDRDEDVLDLTEAMAAPVPQPHAPAAPPRAATPTFTTIGSDPDVVFADLAPAPPPPASRVAAVEPSRSIEPPQNLVQVTDSTLLGSGTRAAVDAAFNSLAHTVLVQNARTLEDIVKDMLRPMLKSWLDDNLPGVVERIVRTEIERVSRGRGA